MPPTLKRFMSLKNSKGEERKGRPVASRANSLLTVEKPKRTRSRSRLGRDVTHMERKVKRKAKVGLLVTKEFATAVEDIQAEVERIANDCRQNNRKFRDPDFDLEYDQYRCTQGLGSGKALTTGKDVQRVTEIFDNPIFFPAGGSPNSSAIRQGALGDCYFLSALATVSSLPGLIEKICVARDTEVGVYGFIFYQDQGWVGVIVDDMLCTNIPKYESLSQGAKEILHEDKEKFNETARKGGRILIYARGGSSDETWVPLIEKAYAKLYGCYAHLEGGWTSQAIEELTGGVASRIATRDILSIDSFWKNELSRVNKDRLFACSFTALDAPEDSPDTTPVVEGLYSNHAYAVLHAREVNGRRFVVLRNPWGEGEWKGAWSDGAKEWTPEWLKLLPQLHHTFGDDGQFIMEYKDFLRYFANVERVVLFNDTWNVSSCWLNVPLLAIPMAPAYGTLSYHVVVPGPRKNKAVFVLGQLNNRGFNSIKPAVYLTFEFSLVRQGEYSPLATRYPVRPFNGTATLEMELEAGEYIVYVKYDQWRTLNPEKDYEKWVMEKRTYPDIAKDVSYRMVSRILTNKVKALSLTQNWDGVGETDYLRKTLEDVIREDIEEMLTEEPRSQSDSDSSSSSDSESEDEGASTKDETIEVPEGEQSEGEESTGEGNEKEGNSAAVGEVTIPVPEPEKKPEKKEVSPAEWVDLLDDLGEQAALGLRVYTQTQDIPRITGRIRSEDVNWEY